MDNIISNNLRRLRLAKNLTQAQAAEALGVSTQSVSRWECGNTYPDVMLLPKIARLFCVTVDDLYQQHSVVYDNYAQLLGGIYDASRKPEDFMRATDEFEKLIASGESTNNDMRCYGIIHQFMMSYCMNKAEKVFNDIINGKYPGDEEIVWRTKHQRQGFLAQIGRGQESIERQLEIIKGGSMHPRDWVLLIDAYLLADDKEEAKAWYMRAIEKFPEDPMVWGSGGDVYHKLKQYDDALACWDKALQIDPSFYDYRYAKGFCYEEKGDYQKAYEVWREIMRDLNRDGYKMNMDYLQERVWKCQEKLES